MKELVLSETIHQQIFLIRGQRVMLDRDLARLYGVETRVLNQAVKRNIERFPGDFMFQLSSEEMKNWVSQIVIPNREKMGIRLRPYVFTEQGVAMLSSILKSKRAIQVNIEIMRIFTKLRRLLLTNQRVRKKIEEMELKYDHQFRIVFEVIEELMKKPEKQKRRIGFHRD